MDETKVERLQSLIVDLLATANDKVCAKACHSCDAKCPAKATLAQARQIHIGRQAQQIRGVVDALKRGGE